MVKLIITLNYYDDFNTKEALYEASKLLENVEEAFIEKIEVVDEIENIEN